LNFNLQLFGVFNAWVKRAMMTMTMMQRLLQSEERTHANTSPNIDESDRKASFESTSTLPAHYQFTNRDNKEAALNYGNNNHHPLFFKSLTNNTSQEVDIDRPSNNSKSNKKPFLSPKDCVKSEPFANENGYSEDLVGRLSCESEDSIDVNNSFAEERINLEGEYKNGIKEEDVRSPVDLTNRRLPVTCCGDDGSGENNADAAGTTIVTCRHSTMCTSTSDENSTNVDDTYITDDKPIDVPSTRRLAFSVENILDPNKFTGKQIEDNVKEKFSLPYSWRPHLDFMNSSPVIVNRTGKKVIFSSRCRLFSQKIHSSP